MGFSQGVAVGVCGTVLIFIIIAFIEVRWGKK